MSSGRVSQRSSNAFLITLKMVWFFKGPFQIILALVLLYRQMQLAIIPGVILLLLLIPLNIFIQKIQKKIVVCKMFECV